jgi:signal transduction histidine kinase
VEKRTARIRELERQRTEIEKLGAAGRMATRIAHEINNPLAGIKNSFLLIKDAVPEDHPYYDYTGRIEKEIDRIAWIVRQMFDLHRPDQHAVRKSPLAEVIKDVVILLDSSCREYSVSIQVDISDASASLATQDALLRQVLYNVVQNSIEASPSGGMVRIAAAVMEDTLNITISDQGVGIPEEARFRIFEPFFTTKSGNTTGGLGLGLSVSKGIVEAMGGSIDFESRLCHGTTFDIVLPLNRTTTEVHNG